MAIPDVVVTSSAMLERYRQLLQPSTDVPTSPAQQRDVQRSEDDIFYMHRNGFYALREPMGPTEEGFTTGMRLTIGDLENTFNSYLREWEIPYLPIGNSPSIQLGRQPQAPVVVKPKKKKVAKIKKNVPVAEIVKAVSKHTKQKVDALTAKTTMLEAEIAQEEKMLKERMTKLATSKNRISFFKTQQEKLKKAKKELEQAFSEEISLVKQHDQIQDVAIDSQGRIVITTKPLSVNKEYWETPRVTGVYQIRIDFSQSNIGSGVRVLNITQRKDNCYDSPTISQTSCCWGNARNDVEADFSAQNLTELVEDMLSYITSPNEQHGYMGYQGDKRKGWEAFFADAKACPEGYSWEQYDKEHDYADILPDGLATTHTTGGALLDESNLMQYYSLPSLSTTAVDFAGATPNSIPTLRTQTNSDNVVSFRSELQNFTVSAPPGAIGLNVYDGNNVSSLPMTGLAQIEPSTGEQPAERQE